LRYWNNEYFSEEIVPNGRFMTYTGSTAISAGFSMFGLAAHDPMIAGVSGFVAATSALLAFREIARDVTESFRPRPAEMQRPITESSGPQQS
jgi:hypothetical protein